MTRPRTRTPSHARLVLFAFVALWGTLPACGLACNGTRRPEQTRPTLSRRELLRERPIPTTQAHGDLTLRIADVTSSRVRLAWDPVSGQTRARVLLGAEPPDPTTGELPDAVEVGHVDGNASTFSVENLAAGCDAFLRVEVTTSEGAPRWNVVHARPTSGARVELDTPLREVYAYGPRTLALVLEDRATHFDERAGTLNGNDGANWQQGTWTVTRRNGQSLRVTAVHRRTMPVSLSGYVVGFNRFGDGNQLDLDHHVFLVLDEPLGSRDVFFVHHDARGSAPALDVRVPFSDDYLETPFIQVNQVGYNPRATKRWAYVSGWMGDGGPVPLDGLAPRANVLAEPRAPFAPRRVALADVPITSRATQDGESGGAVSQIDLARLPAAEGVRYHVQVPGVGVSYPTAVSEEAAFFAFYTVARGLFHNRWCGDLDARYTEWSRPADHCRAYFVTGQQFPEQFPETTPHADERPVRGGHHDAGDFDIRAFHVVVAQNLMRAFEMHPDAFTDGQLGIPESGNGIPDLLDEALWSLQAWEALQNRDGSIRAGVESTRHPPGIYLASDDQLAYFTFDPMPWHTMYVAALFAQAAHLVAPFDAARAAALRAEAVRAYDAPIARTSPPAYALYAASELFRLTGEERYRTRFETAWRAFDRYGRGAYDAAVPIAKVGDGSFTDYSPVLADYPVAYAAAPRASGAIANVAKAQLAEIAEYAAEAILESPHGHRSGRTNEVGHDWGGATSTGRQADAIYQSLQISNLDAAKRQRFFDAMSVAADYVLGCNPASYVYVTGLGTKNPREPLHLDSLVFVRRGKRPMPGIPVFGPVEEFPGLHWYHPIRAGFYPAYEQVPVGARVTDVWAAVNMSEFTVWQNQAPLTELFGALLGVGRTRSDDMRPGQPRHTATLPAHTAD